ncbi:hypothetical protein Bca4012_098633 [Brassica carinata]
MGSGVEAGEYASEYMNMQEGSPRCVVNISIRPIGQVKFVTKQERCIILVHILVCNQKVNT